MIDDLVRLLAPAPLTEELDFILNLGVAVAVALGGGLLAARLGLPAVVGYVLAGVLIGPFTPGFQGDAERLALLSELGIIFLLFALGVELSVRELRAVGRVVVIGSLIQVAVSIALGSLVAVVLGFGVAESVAIGAALAISSTLVLVKLLDGRGEGDALHGRVAIGWSAMQDILTVVLIVALPSLRGDDPLLPLLVAVAKAVVFLALSYFVGTRLLPWLFGFVARIGSSELFLLTVFGTALLAALVSSAVFGLSLALGAFVAGLLISEADVSHQAAAEILPFRDVFAVLFFVSVGMLIDPAALVPSLVGIAALAAVVVGGKWLLTAGSATLLGLPLRSAVLAGAALAQAGEFTFLLASEAGRLGILEGTGYNLVLGTAVITILVASPVYAGAHRLAIRVDERAQRAPPPPRARRRDPEEGHALVDADAPSERRNVVVLGGGRVGTLVARAVVRRGFECVVVDRDQSRLEAFRRMGALTVFGDAANVHILRRAVGSRTSLVVVALADHLTARLAVARVRAVAPRAEVVARVAGAPELRDLRALQVRRFAEPRAEAGIELARQSLQRLGVSSQELAAIVQGLRSEAYGH